MKLVHTKSGEAESLGDLISRVECDLAHAIDFANGILLAARGFCEDNEDISDELAELIKAQIEHLGKVSATTDRVRIATMEVRS